MNSDSTSTTAPYGSWHSPITADLLVSDSVRLSEATIFDGRCYWLESRPSEKGRSVLVEAQPNGERRDINPAPLSIRSKAHEYGGASYLVDQGIVYFVLAADQRVYRMALGAELPEPLTPEGPYRHADLFLDRARNRLICVQENDGAAHEPEARIITIPLEPSSSGTFSVLIDGDDFYSNPALSPDGKTLSYLRWSHPNMPWDATELCLVPLDGEGNISADQLQVVAGQQQESIFQPQWSPSGELFYVSDRNNWWNLYRQGEVKPIWQREAEFATPQWVFGMSTYGFLSETEILCTFTEAGRWRLGLIDLADGGHQIIDQPNCDIESLRCDRGQALFIGASATSFPAVIFYDDASRSFEEIASSNRCTLPEDNFSVAQAVEFPSGQRDVHAFYYAPTNPGYAAPEGDLPPLIVFSHGGPTGATAAGLNLKVQYWTSRGFAILDVNYSGSTGYGRKYRDRLRDRWGIWDVEDVCAGAEYLVAKGLADPHRLLIKGGSAGGYTVLAALTFHNTFKAGASHYGIGDLSSLARDTHKFESRYLDKLVGPWPDAESTYRERSPICHVEQLDCPVIFFQGLEDKVVPPEQAETMVAALKARDIPVAYIAFPEEGHGFRSGDSIKLALEGELEFYSRVFHFPLAQPGPGITIENLD